MKKLLTLTSTFLLVKLPLAENDFWSDFRDTNRVVINNKLEGSMSTLANFIWEIIKYSWYISVFISIIAVIYSFLQLAVHAEDSPSKKTEAKHDIGASLISLAILGSAGIIWNLIVAFLS